MRLLHTDPEVVMLVNMIAKPTNYKASRPYTNRQCFSSKVGLFEKNEELKPRTCNIMVSHAQVLRTKEGRVLLWRKGGVQKGSCKQKIPLEEAGSSQCNGFSLAEL